jgi:hypothetical protein
MIMGNLGALMAKLSFPPFSKDVAWNLSFHKNKPRSKLNFITSDIIKIRNSVFDG